MKFVTLTVMLFGITQSMPTGDIWEQLVVDNFDSIDHVQAFKSWQKRFDKEYKNTDEEAAHFLQFLDNWKLVNEHNKLYNLGKTTFSMGLNQFGDMSFEEFRLYVHGHDGSCIKNNDNVFHISTSKKNNESSSSSSSSSDETVVKKVDTLQKRNDDGFEKLFENFEKEFDVNTPNINVKDNEIDVNMGNFGEFKVKFGRRLQNVPNSIDWTNINGSSYVTPVKNQGQCGSCWAFSTTGSIESRSAIKNGWTGSQIPELSEQQLVDCSRPEGNAGCNGGLMEDAFKYVQKEGGLCTESEYPYTARDGTCKASTCGKKYDSINGYKVVEKDSEPALQAAVAEGPVSISVDAAGESWQFYRGGVLDSRCGILLDHGVLAVGYGHDSSSNLDYWKVKNSWGKTWGEEGYIRICRNCDKNGDAGECGILRDDSYPTL